VSIRPASANYWRRTVFKEMTMNRMTRCLLIAGLAAAPPSFGVALPTSGPAQPLPGREASPVGMQVADTVTSGSATLVPLVAADLSASQASTVDASAPTHGGAVGKPIDDISFVARATESARREMSSARDALPQLTDPDLKRTAERLVADHGDANAKLAKLAEQKMWPVPGPEAHETPPAGTASHDFDSKWTAEMIAAHERSVALYSAQAQGGEDTDLRKYARETLPTIQNHLAELRRLQK
jgi:putative membrane protein